MFYMIELKSARELELMRAAGRIVAESFLHLEEAIRPGLSLRELDRLAERYLRSQGALPVLKGYRGSAGQNLPFPGAICTSVNEQICHGIPDERVLQPGDIVSVDLSLKYRGYHADACVTYGVGELDPAAERLLEAARACLQIGIEAAQPGGYMNDIGTAIERRATAAGFSVVRDFGGHGIGRRLHEGPDVSHVRLAHRGPRLRPGMVFTIEPMLNMGTHRFRTLPDGWTEVTADGALSAQFEHTVAVTANGPEILTRL